MSRPYSMYGREHKYEHICVGKCEGKRRLGKPRLDCRLEKNIRIDLKKL
jgi:hypothetical protein